MPKKMMPKSQAKKKKSIPAIPIFNYFLTPTKYHASKYTFLSLNHMMRVYRNKYDCPTYLQLL